MRDRATCALADEIALCRQYLDLEKLRLGDRLNVEWEIVEVPLDLKVPPLMLQPLLENAVYHGIEPATRDACVIRVRLLRRATNCIEVAIPALREAIISGGTTWLSTTSANAWRCTMISKRAWRRARSCAR
jgi:LytS/YehU family sensor histidine kinase